MKISFNRLNTPSTAKPSILNGNNSSQKIGYKMRAIIANGHEIINKNINTINVNIGL